jgi:hypothetical protein
MATPNQYSRSVIRAATASHPHICHPVCDVTASRTMEVIEMSHQTSGTVICNQFPPASKRYSICGIITPHKRGVIHADKRQRNYRYRVAVRTGLAGAAMRC